MVITVQNPTVCLLRNATMHVGYSRESTGEKVTLKEILGRTTVILLLITNQITIYIYGIGMKEGINKLLFKLSYVLNVQI